MRMKCEYNRVLESTSERIMDLCLVQECKEVEEVCGVECTELILMGEEKWGKRSGGGE